MFDTGDASAVKKVSGPKILSGPVGISIQNFGIAGQKYRMVSVRSRNGECIRKCHRIVGLDASRFEHALV